MDKNIQLLERMHNGEKELENKLIEQNMGLVHSIAKKFLYSSVDFEDLCQIGSIGLLKAIRNFDISKGVMFSTYAVPVIIGEIRKFLRDDGIVKVSRGIREQYIKIQRESEHLTQLLSREPTLKELSSSTGMAIEDIILVLEAGPRPVSLDESISEDGELTIGDTVSQPDPISNVELIALKEGILSLDRSDRQLITLRYFLGKTQQEAAEILKMTQVQVSRREKKIMENLRKNIGN
jgi:RNA polymerase sporulation-specific sigma factor